MKGKIFVLFVVFVLLLEVFSFVGAASFGAGRREGISGKAVSSGESPPVGGCTISNCPNGEECNSETGECVNIGEVPKTRGGLTKDQWINQMLKGRVFPNEDQKNKEISQLNDIWNQWEAADSGDTKTAEDLKNKINENAGVQQSGSEPVLPTSENFNKFPSAFPDKSWTDQQKKDWADLVQKSDLLPTFKPISMIGEDVVSPADADSWNVEKMQPRINTLGGPPPGYTFGDYDSLDNNGKAKIWNDYMKQAGEMLDKDAQSALLKPSSDFAKNLPSFAQGVLAVSPATRLGIGLAVNGYKTVGELFADPLKTIKGVGEGLMGFASVADVPTLAKNVFSDPVGTIAGIANSISDPSLFDVAAVAVPVGKGLAGAGEKAAAKVGTEAAGVDAAAKPLALDVQALKDAVESKWGNVQNARPVEAPAARAGEDVGPSGGVAQENVPPRGRTGTGGTGGGSGGGVDPVKVQLQEGIDKAAKDLESMRALPDDDSTKKALIQEAQSNLDDANAALDNYQKDAAARQAAIAVKQNPKPAVTSGSLNKDMEPIVRDTGDYKRKEADAAAANVFAAQNGYKDFKVAESVGDKGKVVIGGRKPTLYEAYDPSTKQTVYFTVDTGKHLADMALTNGDRTVPTHVDMQDVEAGKVKIYSKGDKSRPPSYDIDWKSAVEKTNPHLLKKTYTKENPFLKPKS